MKRKTVRENDSDKETIEVSFTNGAKKQLEELTQYFKLDEPLSVIKLGIAFMQKLKEEEEKKTEEKETHDKELTARI